MLEDLVVSYLSTIIQNKDLAMLKWRHGPSISVEVGVCRWVVANEKKLSITGGVLGRIYDHTKWYQQYFPVKRGTERICWSIL